MENPTVENLQYLAVEGVRKIRSGKVHHPPYSDSSDYVLIIITAILFQK